MKPVTKAHISLLLTNIFFAINFTAIKQLINNGLVKPFGLNLVRIFITAFFLWILFIFKKEKASFKAKDYGRLFLCALTGIVINQLLFVKGLSLTYSIHASLLMLTTPILITIIAAWILKERLTFFKAAGLALGVSGAIVLITARQDNSPGSNVLLGDILVILNAASYTFYFILVKPLMKTYDPIAILRMIFTIGFFVALPFCWKEFNAIPWEKFKEGDFLILGVVVIGGTFLAYLFNIYGIKILGASVAGTYIYSQVVFTAVIAMVFLDEKLSLYKIIAGLLIAAGVYLANKNSQNNGIPAGK